MSRRGNKLLRSENGAIMLIGVFMAIFLCGCLFYIVSLGHSILYRTHMQDAADSATMAAAIVHAKGMNAIVFINIMMAALLAILVALRLISTVASAIGIVAGAACVWPPLAALCAVPPVMADVVAEVEDIYSTAKQPIELALQGLHVLAVVVRDVTPALGTAKSVAVVYSHHAEVAEAGVAIPSALTLPTTDDTFEHLCEKAGDLTGDIVKIPFDAVPAIGDLIGGVLSGAISALTKGVPSWFCGSGNAKPPSTSFDHTVYRPTLDSTEKCNEATNNNEEDATALCEKAQRDAEDSTPDKSTGNCLTRCLDDEPYMERAQKARVACNPEKTSKLHSFQWQFRHVTRVMVKQPDGSLQLEEERVHQAALREQKESPCDLDEHGWNEQMWSAEWPDSVAPVCIYSADLRHLEDGIHVELETEEVTHVFSCGHNHRVTLEPAAEGGLNPNKDNKDNSEKGKGGESGNDKQQKQQKNMSPQKIAEGTHNGGSDFQVRGFVWGKEVSHQGELVKRLVAPRAGDDFFTKARLAGRIQLAQGEYFFADGGNADRDDDSQAEYLDLMMWRMKWSARLRRFRFGGDDDQGEGGDDKKSHSQGKSSALPVEDLGNQQSKMGAAFGKIKDMCQGLVICKLMDSSGGMDVLVVH